MSGFNFIQKPSFFQNLGNIYDKTSGGTRKDREFVGNYNSVVKVQEEAKKIYFRVFVYKAPVNNQTLPMLVLFKDNKPIKDKYLTGNQRNFIKRVIADKVKEDKIDEVKGYVKGKEMEELKSNEKAPKRDVEWLFDNGCYYNVWEFMKR